MTPLIVSAAWRGCRSARCGDAAEVDAPGTTVTRRGLSIDGQGGSNGIFVQQAARVRVENSVVSNMNGNGIYDHADNPEMIVSDTISRDNADGGLAFVASGPSMLLHHVHSEHNQAVGFYVAPSTVSGNVRVDIVDSVFAYNGAQGIWADSIGSTETIVDVERSVVSKSGGDGFYASAAASNAGVRVTLRNDVFGGNGMGLPHSRDVRVRTGDDHRQ